MILCGLLTAFFLSYAVPVEYKDVIPAQGSAISSWSFTLKFDIANALASVTDTSIQYGIGYSGSEKKKQYAALYKGDVSEESLLGVAMTSNVTGKSEEFKINGDEINIEFDSSIPIIKGQEYILQITNTIVLCKETGAIVSNTKLDYSSEPLTLKFIGGDVNSTQFILSSSSVKNGDSLKSLSFAEFVFAHPIKIDSSKYISINEGNKEIARSESLSLSDDNTVLRADFGREISLNATHSYTLLLPAGIAEHAEEASLKNADVSYLIYGLSTYTCPIRLVKTEGTNSNLPSGIVITYDIPEKLTFTQQSSYTGGLFDMAYLYDASQPDSEPLYSFVGVRLNDGKSIKWDLSNIAFVPSSKYMFRTLDNYKIFETGGNILNEYTPESKDIEFSTPSIEEMNLPKIELNNTPRLGAFNDASIPEFKNGGSYASIGNLEIKKTPYLYNDQSINPTCVDGAKAYIYEVANGERTLIKDAIVGGISHEEKYEYVHGIQIWVNTTFYSGHKYEIVIPAGSLEIASIPSIRNYTTNEEIVYTLNGATTKEIKLESCSVKEGETLSELAACVWVFDGNLSLKQGATGTISTRLPGSAITSIGTQPLFAAIEGGKTYVTMSLADKYGNTKIFDDDSVERWLTLPAGVIFIPGDDETSNEEIIVNFKGTSKYVTLSVETEGLHAHSNKAPKGEFSEVRLTPDSFWDVSELTLNGEDVTADLNDGVYTTPVLTEDTSIKAKLAYNGSLVFADTTTGVAQLPETNVKIYSDGDTIVIEGVATGDEVVIYSISGMVIGRHVANQDTVRITIGRGQYIVRVGNNAANILH